MRKLSVVLATVLALIIYLPTLVHSDESSVKVKGKNVKYLLKVDNVSLTDEDVQTEMNALPEQAKELFKGPEGTTRFIDELAKKEMLYLEAKKQGLDGNEDFGKKVEDFKKITIINELLEKEIAANSKVTEKDTQDFYNGHIDDFMINSEIRLSRIVVPNECDAKKVYEQLKSGTDFARVAAAMSIDKETAKSGGEMGAFKKGELAPEVEKVVFGLKKGEVSATPLQLENGFIIYKVTDVKGTIEKYDQVKGTVTQRITAQKQKAIFDKYMDELKKGYPIKINSEALEQMTNGDLSAGSTYLLKVDNVSLTKKDVQIEINALPKQAKELFKGPEGTTRFIDELAKKEMLYLEAKKQGLDGNKDFEKKVEDFKKITLINELLKKEIEANSKVTDKDAEDFYNSHKDDLMINSQIRLSQIVVQNETDAKKVYDQLKSGMDFAKMAVEMSTDKKSAKSGGDMGSFKKGELSPELDQVVFRIKKGDVSSSPVKLTDGIHIFKVSDAKGATAAFDEVKGMIVQRLTSEKEKIIFNAYIENLKKNYTVEINKDGLARSEWEQKNKDEPDITLLLDEAVTINKDYSTITHLHIIKKIQKESAKSLGDIPFFYDQSREEITAVAAYTITPDGQKLQCEKIQDMSASGQNAIYSDERKKVIIMPGVVVGSIIDLEVTVKCRKPNIEHNFFDSFSFSTTAPIKDARYSVTAPSDTALNIRMLNASVEPVIERNSDTITYTWTVYNSDKVNQEEYMPSPEEVNKFITISTLKDWKQLSDWQWSLFTKNMTVTAEMKQKITEVTKDKTTLSDKVQAIIDYIRQDYRYVAMHMESHNYEPHPANEIFKNKYGDCKDQTLLAITLLSKIGVKAFPVLMSSISYLHRGDLLPIPSYFDHVILAIEVDGKCYYTDVLTKGYRFQELPSSYEGRRAFVLNDKGGFFTVLPVQNSNSKNTNTLLKVTIKDDGTAVVETTIIFSRDDSVMLRKEIAKGGPDEREKALAALETVILSGGKLLEKTWENIDMSYDQITVFMRFESSNIVQRMGDMMMFGLPPFQRKTEFSSRKRFYPVVFNSPYRLETRVTYIIPDGYEISVMPKKIDFNPLFAGYIREYESQGAQIVGREFLELKTYRLSVEEYPLLQNFFDDIVRKTNDKILIKKKT